MATSVVTLIGTATLAQQAGGGPQPQLGPNTPGGTPPAETTPSHPLNSTTGPKTGTTTGAAPRQGAGMPQGNNATNNEKK
jgi:hypothetical protein